MLNTTILAIAATALIAAAGTATAQTTAAPTAPTQGAPVMPTPIKSGYAPVNGVSVYYAVYGKGEPIVLLHGGFGAIEMLGPTIAALAQNHQVIGVDLQGHGRTLPFDRTTSPA
jgi:curli biogenesis system outer membrane secretion channel CsgG